MARIYKIGGCGGHSEITPGKRSPDDEREWHFNNIVITAFEKELLKYKNVEFKRFDDRTGKTDIPLQTRTNQANSWGADYYISFHHNALKDDRVYREHTGVETFVYSLTKSIEAVKLAEVLHPAIVQSYGLRNRGIKEKNLHICRETKMPAILVEGGFMDSSIDIYKLRSKQVLENAGINVAKALASYLKLELKVPSKTQSIIDPNEPSSWAKKEWNKAVDKGIFDGTNPRNAFTREQAAIVLDRLGLLD